MLLRLPSPLYIGQNCRVMKETPRKEQKTKNRNPGETLKDKIHRHLSDKNDIITEEDIRDMLIENDTPEKDLADKKTH